MYKMTVHMLSEDVSPHTLIFRLEETVSRGFKHIDLALSHLIISRARKLTLGQAIKTRLVHIQAFT